MKCVKGKVSDDAGFEAFGFVKDPAIKQSGNGGERNIGDAAASVAQTEDQAGADERCIPRQAEAKGHLVEKTLEKEAVKRLFHNAGEQKVT